MSPRAEPGRAGNRTSVLVGGLQDPERDCSEMVPKAHSATGVTDDGQEVVLDVLVFLDGITKSSARKTLARAGDAYSPLKITLRTKLKRLSLASDGTEFDRPTLDAARALAELKTHVGGVRPEGVEVVHLLTDKLLYLQVGPDRVYGVAGVAYCIGGIRWPETSFSVGVGDSGEAGWTNDQAAQTTAHEIGHLMGAHHHYANCVEGTPPSLCTVMFNGNLELAGVGYLRSLKFGTAESAVIRGHAVDFVPPEETP